MPIEYPEECGYCAKCNNQFDREVDPVDGEPAAATTKACCAAYHGEVCEDILACRKYNHKTREKVER